MANQGNEDFYYNLTRKELQSLCKRYGLPANKSHSDLAMSLVAYLEEGCGGPMYNPWENFAQWNGNGLGHNESPIQYSRENFWGLARDKTVENVPQIECGDINSGACPAPTDIGCSVETSTRVSSSFEFHVRSEEGINLYVDLNSSVSEWTKRFKKENCICENVHSNKSVSLHQDLGCFKKGDKEKRSSFLQNINSGKIKDGHVPTKDYMGHSQPFKVDGTLVTSAVRPCNMAVDVSEDLTENQALISSQLDYAAQNQIISGVRSYAKDGFNSNVFSTFQKSIGDTVVNSIAEDQLSPVTMERQKSKLQNGYNHVNLSAVYPGYSAGASIDRQSSKFVSHNKDALCSPCVNGGLVGPFAPRDNADKEKCVLASSCELNPGVLTNYVPKSVEEWERSNITNGRESPEGSQLTSSVEKNCFCYENFESNEELTKKRKYIEGEHQSGFGNPDAKIFNKYGAYC